MKKSIKKHLPKGKTVLCLRTVSMDRISYNNFKWPAKGFVEAPDFSPEKVCGQGLHGYLRGCGEATQIKWDGLFQVVKVLEKEVIDLDGKVKFPRCEVIFTGTQKDAIDILIKEYPCLPVIGATVVVGNNGTATAGNYGTATAGYYGTATAGDNGRLIISWYDFSINTSRYRTEVAYVGENGIEANVAYKLNDKHLFVKA